MPDNLGGGMVEPGCWFRVGSGGTHFAFARTVATNDGEDWLDQAHALRMQTRFGKAAAGVVIRRRLEHRGTRVSPPIDLIEPLHLVFGAPSEQWRHLYANGGTTERYYPASAFCTHEVTRLHGSLMIESHPEGRSSNLHLPLLISTTAHRGGETGLFCGLEWSGEWYWRWESLDGGRRCQLVGGVKVNGLRLEPGEVLELPPVHLGFFTGGLWAGTNALRRYLYEQVCPRYEGRPVVPRVSYNHWGGIYNDYDIDLMRREAQRAAALGVEIFVLDAAWFQGDFPDGVGNWDDADVNRRKFPEGLEPLADFVRHLGMGFGLWFEPERAVEGTTVLRQHPEWLVPVPSRGKSSFHLNLAQPEAQDYLIKMVSGWIERLGLAWIKWDYNIEPRPFWNRVDPSGKIQFAYMTGLYRVLDTLMGKYPQCVVEQCASGGRRLDIGTMKRAHTFWISDETHDPLNCRLMQARANRFLPGHLLNSAVMVARGRGDIGFDDAAVLGRMMGWLSFYGDIASWSDALTGRMAQWVRVFKAMRHLVVRDFYQLLPMPRALEDWHALQFVSPAKDEAVIFVFAGITGGSQKVKLRQLDPEANYRLARQPGGAPRTIPGGQLMEEGLRIVLNPDEGALWHLGVVDE